MILYEISNRHSLAYFICFLTNAASWSRETASHRSVTVGVYSVSFASSNCVPFPFDNFIVTTLISSHFTFQPHKPVRFVLSRNSGNSEAWFHFQFLLDNSTNKWQKLVICHPSIHVPNNSWRPRFWYHLVLFPRMEL